MSLNTLTKNVILFPFNILYKINPELDLKILFRIKQGYSLNLKEPKTFNEKIQWIKLNDKNPLMPKCTDKYLVREYVESKELGNILNELLWEGVNPKDIPFETLPNQFVIKVTHGSTFNIICKDKNKLDRNETIRKLSKWMKTKFLLCYGEWFYGIEKPRIIIEKFIESENGLKDFKVYCFHGEPKYIGVYSNRYTNEISQEMYDCEWKQANGKSSTLPNPTTLTPKPKNLEKMLKYARKLSKDFRHVRVDFYNENDNLMFGELTFTTGSGFDKFSSKEFDIEMGNYLEI